MDRLRALGCILLFTVMGAAYTFELRLPIERLDDAGRVRDAGLETVDFIRSHL
jgi:hypothetical protein